MLFWILLVAVIGIIGYFIWDAFYFGEILLYGFVTVMAASGVFFFVGFIAWSAGANSSDTFESESVIYNLEPIDGTTYLSVNGGDLTYAYDDSGWSQLESVPAEYSRVAKDSTELDAHVMVIDVESTLWWWAPWPHNFEMRYEFHIPEDSMSTEELNNDHGE